MVSCSDNNSDQTVFFFLPIHLVMENHVGHLQNKLLHNQTWKNIERENEMRLSIGHCVSQLESSGFKIAGFWFSEQIQCWIHTVRAQDTAGGSVVSTLS